MWRDPRAAKARIGMLPDGLRLFDRLTGEELLRFSGRLRKLPEHETRRRTEDLLGVLNLHSAATTLVVDYSARMRKKVGLAVALLHNPRVLFLDEPFESVDPVSARTIREVLVRYTAGGATVVLSSHSMDLVERTCDQVAVMHRGRVPASGALAAVRGDRTLEEAFLSIVGAVAPAPDALAWLGSSSG